MTVHRTPLRRQHTLVAAAFALLSMHCGGDDSPSDNNDKDSSTPGTHSDAGVDSGTSSNGSKDSGTTGATSDASTGGEADASQNNGGGLDAAAGDAGNTSTNDAGGGNSDAGATDTIPKLNGCEPADYVDRSNEAKPTVMIVGETFSYTPRCLTIKAGQSVTWSGSLQGHPLKAGVDKQTTAQGSPNSPIQETTMGTSVTFAFPKAGTYPYVCTRHVDSKDMVGVVHVKP